MPKNNIHPKYFETQITCITCNNSFLSGSTKGSEIRVDLCSNCHPFYTGKQTFVSAKGRVERFLNKASKKTEIKPTKKTEKSIKAQNKVINLENFKAENKPKKTENLDKNIENVNSKESK